MCVLCFNINEKKLQPVTVYENMYELVAFRIKEVLPRQKSIYVTPGQDTEALNMPCLTFAWAQPAITATDKERKRSKERQWVPHTVEKELLHLNTFERFITV